MRSFAIALVIPLAAAHVGTNDVSFVGNAGPYAVRVTIRQAGVVPGLADITIRAPDEGVQRVLVTALRRVGDRGEAPPPDVAAPVPGEKGLYSAQLWLMVRGAHSVIVTVEGDKGSATATIPIVARANARLAMPRSLGVLLAAGGLFLVVGLLTIVSAAARESVLAPGATPSPADRRRGRIAVAGAAVVLAALLFGGWSWIRAEADGYRARLDRSWAVEASVRATAAEQRTLDLVITEPFWRMRRDSIWLERNGRYRRMELIPDHGKMMHMFVVGEADMAAFAHIHPVRVEGDTFRVQFPPLPAGEYRVFADIVHADGLAHTLVTRVTAPGVSGNPGAMQDDASEAVERIVVDPDDAWWTGSGSADGTAILADGSTVRWVDAPGILEADDDAELVFRVTAPDGSPALLEPYMGMAGHAMLARDDGEVFVHLHPAGMISIAAQQALAGAGAHQGMADPPRAGASTSAPGELRFPLVVPAAGRYRLWVQIQREGRILTGAFDTPIR